MAKMTREQMIDEAVRRAWQGLNERAVRKGRRGYPTIGDMIIEFHGGFPEYPGRRIKKYVNGAVGQVIRKEFRKIVANA